MGVYTIASSSVSAAAIDHPDFFRGNEGLFVLTCSVSSAGVYVASTLYDYSGYFAEAAVPQWNRFNSSRQDRPMQTRRTGAYQADNRRDFNNFQADQAQDTRFVTALYNASTTILRNEGIDIKTGGAEKRTVGPSCWVPYSRPALVCSTSSSTR